MKRAFSITALGFLPAFGLRLSNLFRIADCGLRISTLAFGLLTLVLLPVSAFPPAPYHVLYGLVRDEYGQPLSQAGAQMILETTNGVQVIGNISPNLEPGVNYRLNLPMDSGIRPDIYKPTALWPTVPFRIRVKIGATTYLPMEMVANFANLGKPAQSTRLDLTLGEDANGDGLPDAWQRLLLAMLGPNAKVGPNDDADGDGISNLKEYLAGTYAFDPESGFKLELVRGANGALLLQFMVISPRTYTVYSSTNVQDWAPITFKVPADGSDAPALLNYRATDIRILQVEPIPPDGLPASRYFYKVMVQ
jgi:hypothetical protein